MKTTSSTVLMAPPANPSQVFLGESTGAMGVLPKNLPVKYAIVSPAQVPKMTVSRMQAVGVERPQQQRRR